MAIERARAVRGGAPPTVEVARQIQAGGELLGGVAEVGLVLRVLVDRRAEMSATSTPLLSIS